ncbi:MAG: DNA polymerase III subunit beta [Chloroflexi bacterium]|nr:MAG: DNA polymerase III subunit beta [Chloroflexota bacterium]
MQVSCMQENLAHGLAIVSRAVATRTTLPVLSNILIATDNSRLKLAATNLEIGISCWIGAKVEKEGETTVPARLLTDFVNSLPAETINMDLVEHTQTLHLTCSRYEANIKGIDSSEFPLIPTVEDGGQITLDPDTLKEMIAQVTFAAATDESRPILTGVLTRFDTESITFAAADGFRLSVRTAAIDAGIHEPVSVIIPARALSELGRILGETEEEVEVTVTEGRNQVLFHLPNIDLVSQLIEGNFPDYNQIIPKSFSTRTVVDVKPFLNAVKIASFFARDAANIVRLQIEPGSEIHPGTLTISATSTELGDNVSQLDASIEGEPLEIAFNAKYLLDVLNVIGADQVAVETTTPSSPGVFKPVGGPDFVHVIMPMHIRS